MVAVESLPKAERERLLALMGIDRWLLRASPGSDASHEGAVAAPRPQSIAQAADRVAGLPVVVQLAIVTGETDPLAGRHGAILRHLLRALALDEQQVVWSVRDATPVLAFGAAPGDAADAVLAPPLATLRASGAARRSLWPALRTLRRRLRQGR